MLKINRKIMALGICIIFSLISCENKNTKEKRYYEEIVISAPAQSPTKGPFESVPDMIAQNIPMHDAAFESVVKIQLTWKTPKDWQEKKGSGMRLATFTNTDETSPIECSIVSLGGEAGGIEANVKRWMGQINLSVPSEEELNKFLDSQEKFINPNGFKVGIIDFTALQNNLEAPSMITAIVTFEEATIFVKMTGEKPALLKNRDSFKTLCQSLSQAHP